MSEFSSPLLNYLEITFKERSHQIIILSGAGVSTNAGIPDYRSCRSGSRELLTFLTEKTSSKDFYSDSRLEIFNDVNPTPSHFLAKELYERNLLKRAYTQNIDGLYQKAGLPDEMVVEFHGSISKKNVVRYDEDIPNDVIGKLLEDFQDNKPIIMLVMGTSMKVYPFAVIPNMAPKNSIRGLIGYGIDSIGKYKGNYHETGISNHSQPFKFSYRRSERNPGDRPNGKLIKRNVRRNLEWGWGHHTSKKKWKDFKIVDDVDEFSKTVISLLSKTIHSSDK